MSDAESVSDGPVLNKSDPVLEVEGLNKAFGGLQVTDDVSFAVERGSVTGLIGPNGAGKSTMFNLVSGFYEPDSGSVTVNGTDVTGAEPYKVAHEGMVRTFQTPRKPEGMSVREALLVGPQSQLGESIIPLFTSPGKVREEEAATLERAEQMLERFEIDDLATQPATELSGGQMKLVELARALMTKPDLLLLDEPVAGVNPVLADKLAEFITQVNEEEDIGFLIIEHDMKFIMEIADPIIVLDQGEILLEGPPQVVQNDDRVVDAYLGGPAE